MELLAVDEKGEVFDRIKISKRAFEKLKRELSGKKPAAKFIPPTLEDVRTYAAERNSGADCERFFDHFTSNGWKRRRARRHEDWKAAFRNWEKNRFAGECKTEKETAQAKSFDINALENDSRGRYRKADKNG